VALVYLLFIFEPCSFQHGLGMTLIAKSDHSTGNSKYASYVLRSGDLTFAFTAPYSRKCAAEAPNSTEPLPGYDQQQAMDFVCTHGMAVRAVGRVPQLVRPPPPPPGPLGAAPSGGCIGAGLMLAVGTSSSQGTGHFQQSGHFQQPGLWELEDMCRTLLLAGCVRWK
jgi:hypothetical protein